MKSDLLLKKVIASMACFTFMFIWHKEQEYVFYWVLFNFVAILIELMAKKILTISKLQSFIEKNMSKNNQIRFQCFLSAPLHCFSMISNYFFIGNGVEIGFLYLKRVYYGKFILFIYF